MSTPIRQPELVETVRSYLPDVDEDLLNCAYVFTVKAHGEQMRDSGDPYFAHPVAVAALLAGLKLDQATIIGGLLHDTLEDTPTTRAEIARLFGEDVARLVDGVTKLGKASSLTEDARQAENFRRFVLAMSDDVRVLLIKLGDRLHNIRTLHFIRNPERRRRIARETLDIYAPLAHRIGLADWKEELENTAFRELNGEAYETIMRRLAFLSRQGDNPVERITGEIQAVLDRASIKNTTIGRRKSPYSIWRKMQRKNIAFEQLSDVIAFRVLVETPRDCYVALGAIHDAWSIVPGRFKDFISVPKPNGYQSLHTTVVSKSGRRIEIQIRTHEMHAVAERGVAAHWSYKDGVTSGQQGRLAWLRNLMESLRDTEDPADILEDARLELYQDQVFCFTPSGDLITLPRGASGIDFAYAIHTEVGHHCAGIKINGSLAPPNTELCNGDEIEVVTSPHQEPSSDWMQFSITSRAKSAIRRHIAKVHRDRFLKLGAALIKQALLQAGYPAGDRAVENAAASLGYDDVDTLLVAVAQGHVAPARAVTAAFPDPPPRSAMTAVATRLAKTPAAPITGLADGIAVHLAGCCTPIRGDKIVGIMHKDAGITVHTVDCPSLVAYRDDRDRWLTLTWSTAAECDTATRLRIALTNHPGSLGAACSVIGRQRANIIHIRTLRRDDRLFEVDVDVLVIDIRHLENVLAALRSLDEVCSAERRP